MEGFPGTGGYEREAYFRAVLPAAKMGIMAGIILGIGRAIGETMAVVMVLRKPGDHAGWSDEWCADSDSQYRSGNGLRVRAASRSTDFDSRRAFRVHPDHKPFLYGIKKEG